MDTESLELDLDVLLFAIRSSKDVKIDVESITKDIKITKTKLKEINPVFKVLESYFGRNQISKENQEIYYQNELDKCLVELRQNTADVISSLQPLNVPIPDWFLSKVILKDNDIEEDELQFEIRLFNWIINALNSEASSEELAKLKQIEGYKDLNLAVPPNQTLHGFLPFHVIIDEWKFRDLRMHRKIDTLIKREWNHLLQDKGIITRIEFLTGKVGLIMVFTKK